MQKTSKLQKQNKQAVLKINRYKTMNVVANSLLVDEGQFVSLTNLDIYSGVNNDYVKSRRGSQFLKPASGAVVRALATQQQIVWDVGAEEYLITQNGTALYSQALLTIGNPVLIALATGGAFTLGSTARAEFFISGDKLYILHAAGNFVLRWTGTAFVAFPMGLTYPWISAVTSATVGVISGSYTLGVEKVYRVSGMDIMASTPNRKLATSRIMAVTGTIELKKIKITLQATELDNDSLWTHLRVWRSKNKNVDYADPVNPIDGQGIDAELYEETLITKAEIGAGALTSIATGATLPPGNAGTQAGKPGGVYTIEVNNLDAVFFNLIGIEQMELLPIPAATTGCFCANRIFFAGVQDATLGDASKSNIWYSSYTAPWYAFQYNPLNFVDTGRNGQSMIKLIAFEKDVIGIKESSTGRLPSGNVDLPYQTLDDKIGIRVKSNAAFVPTLGIVALTSDNGDFRVFGYDLRWTNIVNGMDVSLPVRVYTSNYSLAENQFAYINGKLFIQNDRVPECLVLHVKEGRGWTQYILSSIQGSDPFMFTFKNGARLAFVTSNSYLIEFEIEGLDTDVDVVYDSGLQVAFYYVLYTRAFRNNEGRDILVHEYLSLDGVFSSGDHIGYPFSNGVPWPNKVHFPNPIGFTPNKLTPLASIAGAYPTLADREYRLYVQPYTIGTFKWCPLVGNYLAYMLIGNAPVTIRSIELHSSIDENGNAWGAFDPFQVFPTTNTDPTWAQP